MQSSPSPYFMHSLYLRPLFTELVISYFLVLQVIRSVNFFVLNSHDGQPSSS